MVPSDGDRVKTTESSARATTESLQRQRQPQHKATLGSENDKQQQEQDDEEEEAELVYEDAPMNQGLVSNKPKRIWTRITNRLSTRHYKNEWMRPYWLGFGLFLLLFAFWLLDSLKDPILSKLTQGNLDKHQPPAKLFSVFCTLILVCTMEYLANIRNRKQQQQNSKDIQTHQDVLDPGGNWNRMPIVDQYQNSRNKALDDTVSISIFVQIGAPYSVAFIVIAYFLSQFQQSGKEDGQQQSIDNGEASSSSSSFLGDFENGWYILAYIIYATIESFGSISVATFWSYANLTLALEDAEKCYGLIIAIAQIGAIGGSTMVATDHWSPPTLLIVVSLIIVLQVLLMWLYHRRFPPTSELLVSAASATTATRPNNNKANSVEDTATIVTWQDNNDTLTKPFWSGLYLIFKNYYVILILGVSCLYEISLTCLDYQMKLLGLERYDSTPQPQYDGGQAQDEQQDVDGLMTFSQFMGHYGQVVNMTSLFFSLILFPIFIKKCGLRITLRLFPTLLLVVTVIAYVALPGNLGVLFVSLSLLKAMTYSVHDPSKEILYIPTSNAVKFRAKFWIDIVGERISKAVGSGFNTLAGSVDRSVQIGGIPSLLSSAGLWIICYYAGIEFDRLISTGKIVGLDQSSTIDPSTYHRVDVIVEGNDGRKYEDDTSSKPSEVEITFQNDDSVSAFDIETDIQQDTTSRSPPATIEMTNIAQSTENKTSRWTQN